MSSKDTIAAIATPHGVGGIGVIRVSGPQALAVAESITQKKIETEKIQFSSFYDGQQQVIDHGIILFFKSPHSFTGEDVVEFQGHGGNVVQDMLLHAIHQLGVRHAKPGEFSERAFLNNKIDLTQAEAIADLIESGSEAAAKAAMKSLQGDFSKSVHSITDKVINLRCYVEAALDFSEEEIDFLAEGKINQQLSHIETELNELIRQAENGKRLNDGLTLAIAGLPNAGKSSLLNCLTGYETAIVTPIAGTTRDVISENISLNGIPIKIIDTAGLRKTTDVVEQAGIKKAWHEIQHADVVLHLVDAAAGFTEEDQKIHDKIAQQKHTLVYNKLDLLEDSYQPQIEGFQISTITRKGLDDLIHWITGTPDNLNENKTILARRRHLDALTQARDSVETAKQLYIQTQSGELMAEDLRMAQKSLNEITGEFNSEDLLGKIFSSFCIGK